MTGVRMSHLPIAQYCGMGPKLSDKHGAQRRAAMGTAFHAVCAESPDAELLMARLSDKEREQVGRLHPPDDTTVGEIPLRYEFAAKEMEVVLDDQLMPCKADSPNVLTVGHLDMAWIVHLPDGRKVAYVGDIKMSEFTVTEGPDSLQLQAYGYAFAMLNDCEAYCPGIWAAVEGQWWWGELVDVYSFECQRVLQRIEAAALNTAEEYSVGSHCHGCYARRHCQEWLLPPGVTSEELAPYATPGGITADNAYELYNKMKRAKDTIETIEKFLKAYASEVGIRDGNGKVLAAVPCKGRESAASAKELREALGPDAERFIKQGQPYNRVTWIKEKRA